MRARQGWESGRLFPHYSKWERLADGIVHVAGVLFSLLAAGSLLYRGRLPPAAIAGLAVYCAGLVGMFAASASYNLVRSHPWKTVLCRIDHAAIFVMIAGSYTPFAIAMGGLAGHALLAVSWAVAVTGVVAKLWFHGKLERFSVMLYLAQGWIVLFALKPLLAAIPTGSAELLFAGGVTYSLGVIFHLMERLPFHNVIWHVFVLAGAMLQFAAIETAVIAL